jgi:hypothetical protein
VDATLPGWATRETIHDPVLAGWLFGADWVAAHGPRAATFTLWKPEPEAAKAWLIPLISDRARGILENWSGDPGQVLDLFGGARPLGTRSTVPERLEIDVPVEGAGAVVVVTQLADPQWRARWVGPNGERDAAIAPVFRLPRHEGWQAVAVPEPGRWTLRLDYDARDVRQGLVVSGLAWLLGVWTYLRFGRTSGSRRGEPT